MRNKLLSATLVALGLLWAAGDANAQYYTYRPSYYTPYPTTSWNSYYYPPTYPSYYPNYTTPYTSNYYAPYGYNSYYPGYTTYSSPYSNGYYANPYYGSSSYYGPAWSNWRWR